ncbi:hypothetical protein V1477_004340 [Vespula maculifrons]|uniref:Uncharacterized protein n=1 Tax=Vespula maculifrons TaxID=7453 RepID=A0ABD2CTZ3_VESMC
MNDLPPLEISHIVNKFAHSPQRPHLEVNNTSGSVYLGNSVIALQCKSSIKNKSIELTKSSFKDESDFISLLIICTSIKPISNKHSMAPLAGRKCKIFSQSFDSMHPALFRIEISFSFNIST